MLHAIGFFLAVSYVHANVVRDAFTTDDFRLKTYAMSCALFVDHGTNTLRAPWSVLAKPIAKPGKPPPRATAVRYMHELEQFGMFGLIHKGKSGGRDNNQWKFLWQCTNGKTDDQPTVPHSEEGVEQSGVEQSTATVPKNGSTVPFSGSTVPRSPVGLNTRYLDIKEKYPETPPKENSNPENTATATAKANGEDHTPTSTATPKSAVDLARALAERMTGRKP